MKLNTILSQLPIWYASGKSFHLSSAPGRGKTTTISRAPEIIKAKLGLNIGIVIVNAALLTPMDVLGFGIPKHNEGNHSLMVFTKPFFWITSEGKFLEQYDGGIILFDEIDKADVDVKKISGEGAYSLRFGPHQLPPGWRVWFAGNRQQDRSGSTKELDHLINRRSEVEVTDDIGSLIEWMDENGVMPVTKTFTEQNPQVVLADRLPDKQGPYCTPRSIVAADSFLQTVMQVNATDRLPEDAATLEVVAGFVGMAATEHYINMIRLELEMPKYEEIVKDPMGVRCPKDKPDAQMLICYNLAHRVTAPDASAVLKYIDRMPKDFAATFARAAIKRDFKLAMAPAFHKWAMSNAQLMTLINNI